MLQSIFFRSIFPFREYDLQNGDGTGALDAEVMVDGVQATVWGYVLQVACRIIGFRPNGLPSLETVFTG